MSPPTPAWKERPPARRPRTWAAPAGPPPPLLPAIAARDIGDANGPRLRRSPRRERHDAYGGRDADVRDPLSIGAPDRLVVRVHTGIEVAERLGRNVIDADEAVVVAVADERELRALRRPAQRARGTARVDELLGRSRIAQCGPPDLALTDEGDPIALGRDRRSVTLADLPRGPAGHGARPYRLLDACRHAGRVGVFAAVVRAAPTHVDDRLGVRGPLHSGDLLTVVFGVGRDLTPAIVGGRRDPDVPSAARIEHPGEHAARRGRDELVREGCAHQLLQGDGWLLTEEGHGGHGGHGGSEHDRQDRGEAQFAGHRGLRRMGAIERCLASGGTYASEGRSQSAARFSRSAHPRSILAAARERSTLSRDLYDHAA